ncbi:hypothetical protein DFS34DRAFT_590210 [Phlyctochytrium arcticum]|nr:hypothetical protein DFS34DRAFT_590210 [Phlyctochytrium arcticum]
MDKLFNKLKFTFFYDLDEEHIESTLTDVIESSINVPDTLDYIRKIYKKLIAVKLDLMTLEFEHDKFTFETEKTKLFCNLISEIPKEINDVTVNSPFSSNLIQQLQMFVYHDHDGTFAPWLVGYVKKLYESPGDVSDKQDYLLTIFKAILISKICIIATEFEHKKIMFQAEKTMLFFNLINKIKNKTDLPPADSNTREDDEQD